MHVGDQDFVAVGRFDRQERRCPFEPTRAVRGGREVDTGNQAHLLGAVIDDAVDQVADVFCVIFKLDALRHRNDDVETCEQFGFIDGVYALKMQHDAPVILADG